jgi:hypothetical protein
MNVGIPLVRAATRRRLPRIAESRPELGRSVWASDGVHIAVSTGQLLIASFGLLGNPSIENAVVLAYTLNAISLLLVASAALHVIETRTLGRFLLVAGTWYFFWQDAASMALTSPPFVAASSMGLTGMQFSPNSVAESLVYVALFQFFAIAVHVLLPHVSWPARWLSNRLDRSGSAASILLYGLSTIGILLLLIRYGGSPAAAWDAMLAARSGQGPEKDVDIGLLSHFSYIGYAAAAVLLAKTFSQLNIKNWMRFTPEIGFGLVCILPVLLSGTRHVALYVVLPLGLFAIRFYSAVEIRRRVPLLILFGVAVFLLAQLQFALRTSGWNAITEIDVQNLGQTNAAGQFLALLYCVTMVPQFLPFFGEPIEPFFSWHLIPRQIWPDKPIPESWSTFNAMWTQGHAYNVTPGIIGQYYMNFAVAGVIYSGVMIATLTKVADSLSVRMNPYRNVGVLVLAGMVFAFLASSFRYFHPLYLAYVQFGAIAVFILTTPRKNMF